MRYKRFVYHFLTGIHLHLVCFRNCTHISKSHFLCILLLLRNCSCSCGKKQKIRGRDLRSGATKSCGHAQKGIEGLLNSTNEFIDLKDKTFGEWYVIEYAGKGTTRAFAQPRIVTYIL